MIYPLIKILHILFVAISFTLFFIRGIGSLTSSGFMQRNWIKYVTYVVDTLLLATALTLAFMIDQFPFIDAWLTAKVIGLFLYIALGYVALHSGKSKKVRVYFWLTAQIVFIYIVLVAINHNPFPRH